MSDESRDLAVPVQESAPTSISIGDSEVLDLSGMPQSERDELLRAYRKGVLDISQKAVEMRVDVEALRATLDSFANTTRATSEAGGSVTISHSQTTSDGKTEVVMGNTEKARSGKLDRPQSTDRTLLIVIAFVAIGALIAAFVL